jgi:hypothetical protein
MKLYIAGKVSGLSLIEVTKKFGAAQKELESRGYEVVNPLAVVSHQHSITPKAAHWFHTPWEWCLRWCLREMLPCDGIVMLPCWSSNSRGSILERYNASALRIPIYEGVNDPSLPAAAPLLQHENAG